MIRLTLMLLAAIVVTMIVAGEDPDRVSGAPHGADLAGSASAAPAPAPPGRLALDDEAGAIARALAAMERAEPEAPEAVIQQASLADGTEPAGREMWYVTGSRVNLRAGPSTAEAVVGRASRGQTAEVLEKASDGWMRIRLPETGETAYIYGRFLSADPS